MMPTIARVIEAATASKLYVEVSKMLASACVEKILKKNTAHALMPANTPPVDKAFAGSVALLVV